MIALVDLVRRYLPTSTLFPYTTLFRSGFVLHAPETIGELIAVLFDLQKSAGVDHLGRLQPGAAELADHLPIGVVGVARQDRKSTRLNSSHTVISYAVFCLKKKHRDHIL